MPGASATVPVLAMRCGPSWTERYEPTPWPVPWSKSSPARHKRLAREGVDLRAARPLGEHRARDRDMALEHAGEAVAHLRGSGGRRTIVRVMSVVPSSYWPPLSMRKMPAADPEIRSLADAIMRNRRVRARRRRWWETRCPSALPSRAETSPAPPPQRSRSACPSAPRDRTSRESAPSRRRRGCARRARLRARPCSCTAFISAIGSGPSDRRAARRLERLGQPRRRARSVERHARGPLRRAPVMKPDEPIGLVDVGQFAEPRAHRARQLARRRRTASGDPRAAA